MPADGARRIVVPPNGYLARVQELCKKHGITSAMSTAYHPQTDGQAERTNQEIEAYL